MKTNSYSIAQKYFIVILITIAIFYLNHFQAISQIAPVINPAGGFHIDGGLRANTPTNGVGDWVEGAGTGGGFVLFNDGTPVDPLNSQLIKDEFDSPSDLIFSMGSKFNDDPNTWTWSTGSALNKTDINNTMYHLTSDTSNNTWIIVAGDRLATTGTSYIDFEFSQKSIIRNTSGGFSSAGTDGGRTVNDIIISMEYSNGGAAANVHFYFWKPDGSGFKYIEQFFPPTVTFALTNVYTEDVPFLAFGNFTYSDFQFVEAAVNITALLGYIEPCLGVSIQSVLVKTKTSDSPTAALSDFVGPIPVEIDFGTATISYDNDTLCQTGTASINQIGVPEGTYTSSPAGLSLNSTTGEINLNASALGNYTVTYSFVTNFCPKSVSTDIIIYPLPVVPDSITSDRLNVCFEDNGNIILTAFGGLGTELNWFTDSCGGAFIGTGNNFSVTSPTVTTTYYARWENYCGFSSCASVTVNVSSSMSASATGSSQVSCFNASDGIVTISVEGGTGEYSFSLNGGAFQSENMFLNLPSGSYSVEVIDENGCSAFTNSVIIANPPLLTASATGSIQVSCNDVSDGVVTVNANGGTGAFSYSLNGGTFQSSNIFTGLPFGYYDVEVIDENTCSAFTNTVIIVNPDIISASISGSNQVTCFGDSDGQITVTAQGGTGDFTYNLNGNNLQSSNIFTGLFSGTYYVEVYDANGCSATTNSIIIANPPLLTASATGSSQVSCFDAADGQITVTAYGGTGDYSYSLNGGAVQSSNIFSGLLSGSYSVEVFDINGCSATTNTVIIANPPLLTASATGSSQVSCFDASDGVVTVTANGGTGDYSYSLNGGAVQSSNIFSGLLSGSYSVEVFDANGCSAITNVVIIANPPLLTASATGSSQVSCFDASDGQITVTANGGTGTYNYSLNGGTVQSSNMFSGLLSGSYSVEVFDINGCSATTNTVIIANPPLLTASATGSSQVSCIDASDGQITVTANGGTGTYNYSLNGGTVQSSNIFSGLLSGSYSVEVFDENGCSAITNTVIIANPPLLTASATGSSQVSCFDAVDGVVTVTANGGTGAYSYSLNGGNVQSSNIFSGLLSGSYSVEVFDINGCSATTNTVIISNPPLLTASVTGSSQVSCFDVADGIINVTANGGTGAYSYSLNGGAVQSSNIFSNLLSGSYSVEVFDINGCSAITSEIEIANPPLLTAFATGSSQVSCFDALDGEIIVIANGGTGAYSYSLNGGAVQSSNIFTDLPSRSYSVEVFDENGCTATTNTFIIINPLPISASFSQNNVGCYGSNDGSVLITAEGGTSPYEYSIDGGENYTTTNYFINLSSGIYDISIRDINQCVFDTQFEIDEYNKMQLSVNELSANKCFGISDAIVEINVLNGESPYQFSVDNQEYTNESVISNISSGLHYVVAYDKNGCISTSYFSVEAQEPINVELKSYTDANCIGRYDGSIEIEANGGAGQFEYSWSNGMSSNYIYGLDQGLYVVTVTDINNCTVTYQKAVSPGSAEFDIDVKNSFSPNSDGINDYWVVKNLELYPENTLTIINRWGNEIYTQSRYSNTWDGSNLTEGTYYYILKVNMCDDYKTFDGYVTILR